MIPTRFATPGDLSTLSALVMINVMRTHIPAVPDCPLAPPGRQTTYSRTLHRACVVLGGLAQLAAHLGLAEPLVRAWLEAREDPPEPVFLAALEVILLDLEARHGRPS